MSVHPVDASAPPPSMNYQNPAPAASGACGNLNVLSSYQKVFLQQQRDLLETLTTLDMPNKYILFNKDDQPLMYIEEVPTGVPYRHRALDVVAKDPAGQKLFHITRPSKYCAQCAFCCAYMKPCKYEGDVSLYDQNDKHLGHLTQKGSFKSAHLVVEDKDDDTIFEIKGKSACCTPTTDYDILKKDKKVGEIDKLGIGIGTGSNRYEIEFPEDAQPNDKALIIGLAVLIDYRFHFNALQAQRGRRRH